MLRRSVIAAAITVVLFQTGMFVFATPVPVFFLFAVHGRKNGYLSLALSFALLVVSAALDVTGSLGIVYFVYFAMIAVLLGEGVIARARLLKLAGIATLVPWFAVMSAAFIIHSGLGVDLVSLTKGYLASVLDQVFKMQGAVSSLSAPQLAYIRENSAYMVDFMTATVPATLFLFGMFVVSVTMLLTRSFAKKYGSFKYLGNVAAQRFPFWPVWITIACGTVFFINSYLAHNPYLKFLAINGLMVCAGLFFVQGCFVLSFWLHKGRSPFLRILVYGLIIAFLQVVGFMIIALGLSDQWLDYRRRGLKQHTNAV